jgi:hypothetical protein
MNFQYASDLHLEFAQNKKAMSKKPIQPAAEILLLAGDIMPLHAIDQHQDFLNYLSDNFKMTYWLPGNHEYFGSDLAAFPHNFEEFIRPNLVLLNHKVKTIQDATGSIQLVFGSLWSHLPPHLAEQAQKRMLDFSQILYQGVPLTPDTYTQMHLDSVNFIDKALSVEATILDRKLVITHHVPCFSNYPKKHQNDPIMAGFASNLDNFIQKTAPNGWIYGHHHFNIPPFILGKTQLFTNQFGYKHFKKKSGFDCKATLSI